MANVIRTGDPVDSIKDVVRSSVKVPEFDKHLKKAEGHRRKRCGNNNKDEDNSPKTFCDKNIGHKINDKNQNFEILPNYHFNCDLYYTGHLNKYFS